MQRGPVRVSWRREPGRFSLDLTVPANVVAVVHVPAPLARVREQQRPIVAGSRGVQRVETSKLEVVLELGLATTNCVREPAGRERVAEFLHATHTLRADSRDLEFIGPQCNRHHRRLASSVITI